ncbi:MAG: hypothetical protein EKK54_06090 [Neisseriaceae bacterium]|nr:MAG: hypothetical protein EKK54_06090 [Neisseriaceae bacterium]
MSRINIVLDDFRTEGLEQLEFKEKKTKTQLIKEALDLLFRAKSIESQKDDLQEFFGILKGTEMEVDGLEYQRQIREEWERNQ